MENGDVYGSITFGSRTHWGKWDFWGRGMEAMIKIFKFYEIRFGGGGGERYRLSYYENKRTNGARARYNESSRCLTTTTTGYLNERIDRTMCVAATR